MAKFKGAPPIFDSHLIAYLPLEPRCLRLHRRQVLMSSQFYLIDCTFQKERDKKQEERNTKKRGKSSRKSCSSVRDTLPNISLCNCTMWDSVRTELYSLIEDT